MASTLLDCFLEALAKRERHLPVPSSPSADHSPAAAKPFPAARAQADLFSK